jgi:dienelactone hydrolase
MGARHRKSGHEDGLLRRVRAAAAAITLALATGAACTADRPDAPRTAAAGATAPAAANGSRAASHAAGPAARVPGRAARGPALPGSALPGSALSRPAAPGVSDRAVRPPSFLAPDQPTRPGPDVAPEPAPARAERFAVGVRTVLLSRGEARPLPTTIWYPAAGKVRKSERRNARAAAGRFPLVLFSHGLSGRPDRYAGLTTAWAAAGFVVAAPAYPHTRDGASRFDREDIARQPADATHVIDRIRKLGRTPGDLLAGRIDGDRVAAVGHSAGGYTTTGMFTADHDPRLKAAVVIAGWLAPGAFAGPPATLLFIHGGSDTVVPVASGRAAYDAVPWPKWFLTLQKRWHSEYLRPGLPGYRLLRSTVLDFLRWTLYDDEHAYRRLPAGSYRGQGTHLAASGAR